jgi:uncharacterized protein (TIGR03067 family)
MNILAVLMTAVLLGGGDPAKTDLEKLQGTWVLASMETEGHDVAPDDFKNWTASYEQNRVVLRVVDRVRRRGLVTLDPGRKPKAINTWDQDGPYEDQTVPGIYELDGDTLKLCFARPGQERPKEFTTKSGTAFLFCVYKKHKN